MIKLQYISQAFRDFLQYISQALRDFLSREECSLPLVVVLLRFASEWIYPVYYLGFLISLFLIVVQWFAVFLLILIFLNNKFPNNNIVIKLHYYFEPEKFIKFTEYYVRWGKPLKRNLTYISVILFTLLIPVQAIIPILFGLMILALFVQQKLELNDNIFRWFAYKIIVNPIEEKMIRLLITPPLEVISSREKVVSKILTPLHSVYKDVYWEGEFSRTRFGDWHVFKLLYGRYLQRTSRNPVFNVGFIGSKNNVKIFLDVPSRMVRLVTQALEKEYLGLTIEEAPVPSYKFTRNFIVSGDWREKITTFQDDAVTDPTLTMLERLQFMSDDVEVRYQITPISRFYNCIINKFYRNESRAEDKADYEKNKQATYFSQAKSKLFQLVIEIKSQKSRIPEIEQIVKVWSEVENSFGNRVEEGLIINDAMSQSVVSDAEIYSFWHILSDGVKSLKSYQKPLPYPRKFLPQEDFLVNIGYSTYPGLEDRKIGVANWEDLTQHISILGATGSGKSELLKNIVGDVTTNIPDSAMFIMDFKSNFAQSALSRIPKDRLKDVIYIEPAKTFVPMSFFDSDLEDDESASLFVEMVETASSENLPSMGDRLQTHAYGLDDILRNMKEVIGNNKMSVRYMHNILLRIFVNKNDFKIIRSDERYSSKTRILISQILATSNSRLADLLSTVENKIYKFLQSSKIAKNIDNYNAKLNFEDCVKDHKIVIIDFANLKRKQRYIAGLFYTKKIMEAVDKQKNFEKEDMKKIVILIDEAQQPIKKLDLEFEESFSQFRGLNACLIIANQFARQLPENVLVSMKTNCKTRVVMRSGSSEEIEDYQADLDIVDERLRTYIMNLPTGAGYMQTIMGTESIPTSTFQSVMGERKDTKKIYEMVSKQTQVNYFVEDCDVSFDPNDLFENKVDKKLKNKTIGKKKKLKILTKENL